MEKRKLLEKLNKWIKELEFYSSYNQGVSQSNCLSIPKLGFYSIDTNQIAIETINSKTLPNWELETKLEILNDIKEILKLQIEIDESPTESKG